MAHLDCLLFAGASFDRVTWAPFDTSSHLLACLPSDLIKMTDCLFSIA